MWYTPISRRRGECAQMSEVRNKTIRGTSSKVRGGILTDAAKLQSIRALYYVVFNDPRDLTARATELFHVLGEILEGIPPEQLELCQVDKTELMREISASSIE